MSTHSLPLFKALGSKMDFLSQRQRIISQNVANADTPGYQPKDLVPVNFDSVLKHVTKSNIVTMTSTDNQHMPAPNDIQDPKSKKQKDTYEVAPVGNAVVMEEQLMKAGQTVMDYNLMTSLYQKHVGMIKTAIGSSRV